MVGSKCRDFKNREVSNVNAPTVENSCDLLGFIFKYMYFQGLQYAIYRAYTVGPFTLLC